MTEFILVSQHGVLANAEWSATAGTLFTNVPASESEKYLIVSSWSDAYTFQQHLDKIGVLYHIHPLTECKEVQEAIDTLVQAEAFLLS